MQKTIDAKAALRQIAARENVTVEEVRMQIELAILSGACNQSPGILALWKAIPCKSDLPTPEELIDYFAACISAGIDPPAR